nr:hypothetical protein [Tanacetum cinerariifolium]
MKSDTLISRVQGVERGSKASLQEVIPYVSIDELDTYEDSKTLNFSQHLIQWSNDKVNSGALEVWTGEHDKSFEDKPVWDLVEEEPVDLQVYTGDDTKYIKDKHVRDLVGEEPIPVPLQVYAGDVTKSIKDEHVWDLVKEEPKYGALQIYTGDKTKSFKDEHVWDLVEDEPNSDCLKPVHHPRKRTKPSAS